MASSEYMNAMQIVDRILIDAPFSNLPISCYRQPLFISSYSGAERFLVNAAEGEKKDLNWVIMTCVEGDSLEPPTHCSVHLHHILRTYRTGNHLQVLHSLV